MEIRALREGDDRSQFRCGEPDLDRFFHKFAGQNQFRHYVGVTYVAVEDVRILGFATISPAHVEIEGLPATARKKLPRYPLPSFVSPASPSTSPLAARASELSSSASSCSSPCAWRTTTAASAVRGGRAGS